MNVIEVLDGIGLGLLLFRLWPRKVMEKPRPNVWPRVSIIVPARNEEKTLPALLSSLCALDYPDYEVIVLNDRSTDNTAAVAANHPVKVIEGQSRPENWFGKPWACHQASLEASGDYFLFTDADTIHEAHSLKSAISEILATKGQGLSAPPFHLNPTLWEKLLGPFQCFLIALTHPHGRPRSGRIFSIGQYLLFEAQFYKRMGGHETIREEAVDDLSLAGLTLAHGGKWTVYSGKHLFHVRMYESLKDFVSGWRRNFRGGLKLNSKFSGPEVTLYIMALTAVRDPSLVTLLVTLSGLVFLAWVQRRYGRFSLLGVLFFPFSLFLFTAVTLLALYDQLMKNPLIWKNRSYPSGQVPNLPA